MITDHSCSAAAPLTAPGLSTQLPPSHAGTREVERSALVNEEIVYFIFQLELDAQLQRALNYEAYEAAQQIRSKRETVSVAARNPHTPTWLAPDQKPPVSGHCSCSLCTNMQDKTGIELQSPLGAAVPERPPSYMMQSVMLSWKQQKMLFCCLQTT